MDETGSGSSGAWCALHRDRAAADICQRCGAFMCQECNQQGLSAQCPSCLGRAGSPAQTFPLSRDRWSLGELFDLAWAAFTREWLMLCVVALVYFALSTVVSLVTTFVRVGLDAVSPWAGGVAMVLMLPLEYAVIFSLTMGGFRVSFDVLSGKKADLGVLFGQFDKFGKVLLQTLALALLLLPAALWVGATAGVVYLVGEEYVIPIAVVSGLLAIAPFTWLALPVYFVHLELALQDSVGPIQSIKNCFTLVRGARWPVFGMSMLIGLVSGAGVILCCVGALASFPLGQLVHTGLYLALRRGSELDPLRTEQTNLPPPPV